MGEFYALAYTNTAEEPLVAKWARVQDVIAEEPSILGIGDVALKDKERVHRNTGRRRTPMRPWKYDWSYSYLKPNKQVKRDVLGEFLRPYTHAKARDI